MSYFLKVISFFLLTALLSSSVLSGAAMLSSTTISLSPKWTHGFSSITEDVGISGSGDIVSAGTGSSGATLLDQDGNVLWNDFDGNDAYTSVSEDGRYFAVLTYTNWESTQDWVLNIYDQSGIAPVKSYALGLTGQHGSWIVPWYLEMSRTGDVIVAATFNYVVVVDTATDFLWRLTSSGMFGGASVSRDGSLIAVGFANSTLRAFDRNGAMLWVRATPAPVISVDVSQDGGIIVTKNCAAYVEGGLAQGGSGTQFASMSTQNEAGSLRHNAQFAAANYNSISVFNRAGRLIWQGLVSGTSSTSDFFAKYVAVSEDGTRLYTTEQSDQADGVYAIFYCFTTQGSQLWKLTYGPHTWPLWITASADGRTVAFASGSEDLPGGAHLGHVHFVSSDGALLWSYSDYTGGIGFMKVAVSAGGSYVVASSWSGIYFWTSAEIVLSPTSGSPPVGGLSGTEVTVTGSVFKPSGTCTIGAQAGAYGEQLTVDTTGEPACTVSSSGLVSGKFRVGAGSTYSPIGYVVTVTGPGGDSATGTFSVNPRIVLSPNSGIGGVSVSVTGSGFFLDDDACLFSSSPDGLVTNPSCTVSAGIVSGSFTVASGARGSYMVSVTGNGGDAGDAGSAPFDAPLPTLTLTPVSGPVGTMVSVSGSYYEGTTCSLTSDPSGLFTDSWCIITASTLSGGFTVAGDAPDDSYTVKVETDAGTTDSATSVFTVGLTPGYAARINTVAVVPDPSDIGQGSKVIFTIDVQNVGTLDISSAKVQVKIYKPGVTTPTSSPYKSITSFKAGTERTVNVTYTLSSSATLDYWTYGVYVYRGSTLLDQVTTDQGFTVQLADKTGQILLVADDPDPVGGGRSNSLHDHIREYGQCHMVDGEANSEDLQAR